MVGIFKVGESGKSWENENVSSEPLSGGCTFSGNRNKLQNSNTVREKLGEGERRAKDVVRLVREHMDSQCNYHRDHFNVLFVYTFEV